MNKWVYWSKKESIGVVLDGQIDAISVLKIEDAEAPWVKLRTHEMSRDVAYMLTKHGVKGLHVDAGVYNNGADEELLKGMPVALKIHRHLTWDANCLLPKCTSLTDLYLPGSKDTGFRQFLCLNESITSLNMPGCGLSIKQLMPHNTTIRQLNLKRADLDPGYFPELLTLNNLTKLDLRLTNLGSDVMKLAIHPTLTDLNVSANQGISDHIALMEFNTLITRLSVSNANVSEIGAKALARNSTITSLVISQNPIGNNGALALSQNTTLTTLLACDDQYDYIGLAALLNNTQASTLKATCSRHTHMPWEAIRSNNTITDLDVKGISLPMKTMDLRGNSTLTSLHTNCSLDKQDAYSLAQHPSLIYVRLNSMEIGLQAAEALLTNTKLLKLKLNALYVDPDAVEILSDCPSLWSYSYAPGINNETSLILRKAENRRRAETLPGLFMVIVAVIAKTKANLRTKIKRT